MPTYRYKHGDRPLDGYTIQRAAGRGGFGEVYFALSDSGREVALKAVQGVAAVELRGIRQCMNLKSPNLVTIFDVRTSDAGEPFVIMEYVRGPSLQQIIEQSPGGLGPAKTAFFLREIARGLTDLHDAGIVHRDLKPANIFFEDGRVKIGDYGLSKAITAADHSHQTVTVGTVHYMAPEVGEGRYDRGIDIYALGVMVHQMLTGKVPFDGESPAEILIKHATAPIDTASLDEPFARVVRKALAKQPEQRYASAQAMVEEVFGSQTVRESMSGFSPMELSARAAHIKLPHHTPGNGVTPGASGPAPGNSPAPAPRPAAPGPPRTQVYRHVSPAQRGIALVLAAGWFIGINGLQRFYVGKIFTGILWLITFGFFGIGQLIDVILIAAGGFRDRRGRRLVTWLSPRELAHLSAYDEAELQRDVRRQRPLPPPPPRLARQPWRKPTWLRLPRMQTGVWLALPGYVLLAMGMLVAGAMALDLPRMFAAGIPDQSMHVMMVEELNLQDWPTLVHRIVDVPAALMLLFGGAVLTLARWRGPGWHMARALIGTAGLLLCYLMLTVSLDMPAVWSHVAAAYHEGQVGLAIHRLLDGLAEAGRAPPVAVVILLASVTTLAWRRSNTAKPPDGSRAGR